MIRKYSLNLDMMTLMIISTELFTAIVTTHKIVVNKFVYKCLRTNLQVNQSMESAVAVSYRLYATVIISL
jgi:hypothetical protein